MKYTFFWNGPFSNWYPAKFTYKGIEFMDSEQAFMWEKANYFEDFYIANEILKAKHPKESKELGREISGYNDSWNDVRYQFMVDICLEKFKQNEDIKEELMKCENFVEASPYDKVWGIGMSENEPGVQDPANWKGLNLLGKALDEVKVLLS